MVISVFRKVDCDLTVIYNRFYFVFRINFIFIYIVFVQITTCSLFFVFVVYMIFHLLISFCPALHRHIMHTPIKAPTKRPIIKPNTLTPSFSNFLLLGRLSINFSSNQSESFSNSGCLEDLCFYISSCPSIFM